MRMTLPGRSRKKAVCFSYPLIQALADGNTPEAFFARLTSSL
jgi:hypothetical protein